MPQITIRRLPPEVHRALRSEAEREGISAEEKARRLLAEGLFPPALMGFGDRLRALAAGVGLTVERDLSGIESADIS